MAEIPPLACAYYRDLLPDAVAGTLSPTPRAALEAHLRDCPDCSAEFAELRGLQDALRAAPAATPIASFEASWAKVAARLPELPSAIDPYQRKGLHVLSERDPHATHAAPATTPRARRQPPRIWSAIAAVLVLSLLSAGLFTLLSHRANVAGPIVASPTAAGCPTGTVSAQIPAGAWLADLDMLNANEGWAVGGVPTAQSTTTNPIDSPLIMRYSSCQWSAVAAPSTLTGLFSVSFGAANDGWAVGSSASAVDDAVTSLVLHYTGGQWQAVTLPNIPQAQGSPFRVAMYSATEGWMLVDHGKGGYGLPQVSLLRYSQGAWSPVTIPYESPSILAPVGPDEVWVAGETGYEKAFLAEFKNGAWGSNNVPENVVVSTLHMTSPTSGWASAVQYSPSTVYVSSEGPVALQYAGGVWKQVNIAPQATQDGQDIEMFSDAEGWFIDFQRQNLRSYECCADSTQYYSDGAWATKALPFSDLGSINGLTRVGPGEYWALSSHVGNTSGAVILHYIDGAWAASTNP